MERAITGFHPDDEGEWVAELSCGHNQHVRHRPPFQLRPWVVEEAGRNGRLGAPLDCPLCDRGELPEGLRYVRTTPTWDRDSVPRALRGEHQVGAGTWGNLTVEAGSLRFRAATAPPLDTTVEAGGTQAIPPEVLHRVELEEGTRFSIDFLAVDRPLPVRVTSRTADAAADPGT